MAQEGDCLGDAIVPIHLVGQGAPNSSKVDSLGVANLDHELVGSALGEGSTRSSLQPRMLWPNSLQLLHLGIRVSTGMMALARRSMFSSGVSGHPAFMVLRWALGLKWYPIW